MAKKKTALQGKTWRLGGEALLPAPLSETEEHALSEIFTDFQRFSLKEMGTGVSASAMRGRETVARACLAYFCEQFGGQYAREAVTQALCTAVALPVKSPDLGPDANSVILGAVFWTLDYVDAHNLHAELLPLLPDTVEESVDLRIPLATDFRYSRELVLRVAWIFVNRKKKALREFRKVLGLIRKDDAVKLRKGFKDVTLDYFGRFLEVCKRVAPTAPAAPETPHPLTPLPNAKDLFSTIKERPAPPTPRDIPERTPDLNFLVKTPSLIGAVPERMQSELYYRRMRDLLSEFTVKNPYDLCAAALLLERENDLLMNLNTLTTAVLACAERYLPWTGDPLTLPIPVYGKTPFDTALRYPYRVKTDEDENDDDFFEGQILSVGQLFYFSTGYLLPRDRGPSDELSAWFRGQGLSPQQAHGLAMAAMAFSTAEQEIFDTEESVWRTAGEKSTRGDEESRAASAESDDAERIAELSRQLKSAKQSAHDKEQFIRQLEEQLRDETRRAEQDRMELRGLRETLFRTRAVDTREFASTENPIQLPWQVRRRILIFGGHDTWSKSIRPLLPGARFFERESLPDLNAIKGADVVWIQANALSHKFYYRIIETARKENILVRYFSFASARKCAEQVVETELAESSASDS